MCLAAASLLAAATPGVSSAQVQVVSDGGGVHAGQLEVAVSQSQVLRVDRPYAQALIGNQQIADVLPLTNQSLYVLGKRAGTTSLTLYDRARNLIAVVDVVVGADVTALRREITQYIPNENIDVRLVADSIVLSGVVTNAVAAQRAVQLAEAYLPGAAAGQASGAASASPGVGAATQDGAKARVINLLSVGSSQQVMLEVRFAEMRRGAAKRLGINNAFRSDSGDIQGAIGDRGPSSALLTNENGVPTIDIGGILDAFGIAAVGYNIGSLNIFTAIDALERNGIVTTLAEPTLIALSGETASFLAGGEFPIPVLQTSGGGDDDDATGRGITIEYKPFGVSLAFTPTVLADGVISLLVAPEVSSIDPTASINLNGLVIPGLQVRRARTTLELRDGQSFAMAGLLRRDFTSTVRRFPVLGSLPVIGALFRSTGFNSDDTELVIIVTPRLVRPVRPDQLRLPTDRVKPPTEADLFLRGRTDSAVQADPVSPTAGSQPIGRAPINSSPSSSARPAQRHMLEERQP
jgi:pilus assembly protein CpaC